MTYIIFWSHSITASTVDFHSTNSSSILGATTNNGPLGKWLSRLTVYQEMRVQFSQGPYRTKGTAHVGDSTVSRGLVVHFWPLRLVVRTRGFHPRNSSSILLVANGECLQVEFMRNRNLLGESPNVSRQ